MAGGFGDVVVVLPGLIGSVLTKDGKPLWGASPGALWRTVVGDSLERLKLTGEDNGDEDLGDGIVASGLVPNPEIIPGLWKQGGYSRLGAELVSRLGLIRGENYFEFPYDWRRDNRVSARKLARVAPQWLAKWKASSGKQDAKIVLVSHSMGGLVGRYFMECLEGWKIVRTMVSFGTPYRGAGNAVDFLCNGFTWKVGPVSAFDGTDALRSFDSAYQLLPVYPFVEHGATELARISEVALPHLDASRVLKAKAFHDEMREAPTSNGGIPAYAASGMSIRPVVGTNQPTKQSAILKDGVLTSVQAYDGEDMGGDGTVPRISAIPIDDKGASAIYFATSHSALQSVPAALDHLKGVMTGIGIDLDKFRSGHAGGGQISLSMKDAYSTGEPVLLEAKASEYTQSLSATVQRLDKSVDPESLVLRPRDDTYRGELSLPPGLYRASVGGKGLEPVEDIFLVLDPGERA